MKDTKKSDKKDLKTGSRGVSVIDKSKDKSISQKTDQPSVHIGDDGDNMMLATMMNKLGTTYNNESDKSKSPLKLSMNIP